MSLNLLSLPVDIPWKRLISSYDMTASGPDLDQFPLKWRSSIALFHYRPEIDTKEYEESRLLYFKVVCSITGYQSRRTELPLDVDGADDWDDGVWTNIQNFLERYFPCVGAIVQTAFTSGDGGFRTVRDYTSQPVIMNFEPKKREIYEAVTETGEVMSGTANALHVTKSNSTTQSTETSDTHKADVSLAVPIPGVGALGGKYGYETNSSRKYSHTESDVTQSDASQERRETTSHTTQLTQMYQQLDSYHLGTNRALSVIFPRPHIVPAQLGDEDDDLKWVRKLEGIQEFFFVVEQPKSVKELCVSTHLETMHVGKTTRTYQQKYFDPTEKRERVDSRYYYWNNTNPIIVDFREIKLDPGFVVDKSRGFGGYDEHIVVKSNVKVEVKVFSDYVRIEVKHLPDFRNESTVCQFQADYVVYGVSAEPRVEVEQEVINSAFVTGRHLRVCLSFDEEERIKVRYPNLNWEIAHPEYVTFEAKLPGHMKERATPVDHGLHRANVLQRELRNLLVSSVNSPRRYPAGTHSILETDFAASQLMTARLHATRDAPQTIVSVPDALRRDLDAAAVERLGRLTLNALAGTPAHDLAARLRVPAKTIQGLRLAQVGVTVTPPRRTELMDEEDANAV